MIYKSEDIAYRFILLFDIPSKKECFYFVFDECRVQHENTLFRPTELSGFLYNRAFCPQTDCLYN